MSTEHLAGPRPEYQLGNHYRKDAKIPFEYLVYNELCYVNLANAHICPKCGSRRTSILRHDGSIKTGRNHLTVMAVLYMCDNCDNGYIVANAMDNSAG